VYYNDLQFAVITKTISLAPAIFPYWMTRSEKIRITRDGSRDNDLGYANPLTLSSMDEQGIPYKHPHLISASAVNMTSLFKKLARPGVDICIGRRRCLSTF
jgi:hypothetical protein